MTRREGKKTATLEGLAVDRGCSNILAASTNVFPVCDPVTLTFDLVLIGGRGIVMDCLCAKFGDFSPSRFGFIVQTDRQTNRITELLRRINAILTRLPSAC